MNWKSNVSLSVRDNLPISPVQSALPEPRGQYVPPLCMLSNIIRCCGYPILLLGIFSALQYSAILTFYISVGHFIHITLIVPLPLVHQQTKPDFPILTPSEVEISSSSPDYLWAWSSFAYLQDFKFFLCAFLSSVREKSIPGVKEPSRNLWWLSSGRGLMAS